MNVATIKMDRAEAQRAFREYQAAVRADRPNVRKVWKAEDVGLMQAYKQLARGRVVIDIHAAFRDTGSRMFDDVPIPLPKLAIAASDAPKCFLTLTREGGATFASEERTRSQRRMVTMPAGTFPAIDQGIAIWRHNEHSTLVPLIPPQLRPKHNLANYRTLWEVDSWKKEPPRDPMLLKPLGGALYVVLATWDLTDIERAILRGR